MELVGRPSAGGSAPSNGDAVGELASTPYSKRYPWILSCGEAPVSLDLFDNRTQNALRRASVRSWADLGKHCDASIATVPHVGMVTIRRLNAVLASRPGPEVASLESASDYASVEPEPTTTSALLGAASEWATVVLGITTLRELLEATQGGVAIPEEVAADLDRVLDERLDVGNSLDLPTLLEHLLSEAKDAELMVERALARKPPTLEKLAEARGITRERVRQKVANDVERVRSLLLAPHYRAVRWAIQRLNSEVGPIADVDSATVAEWRERCGERFEFLRWLAGYTYKDSWMISRSGDLADLLARFEKDTDEWLISLEMLERQLGEQCDAQVFAVLLVNSGRWRDIGNGWLVRWDGPIQAKAERVLRLACVPMTPHEIIAAIGHGSEGALKNQRGDRLIRVDKHFRLALPEWGLEEYEGIVPEIKQRIERGGGVARRSEIVDEFTRSFGVSNSSVETYLNLAIFETRGDEVRLRDEVTFVPRSPASISGSVATGAGWGERHVVSESTYKGYSFALSPHICWANGLRPGDDLLVQVDGSSLRASVIWRTTNPNGTVDVGRVREWFEERRVPIGTEVLVCPSRDSVVLTVGVAQIEAARTAHEAKAPAVAADIASLMEDL